MRRNLVRLRRRAVRIRGTSESLVPGKDSVTLVVVWLLALSMRIALGLHSGTLDTSISIARLGRLGRVMRSFDAKGRS